MSTLLKSKCSPDLLKKFDEQYYVEMEKRLLMSLINCQQRQQN